MMSKKEAVVGCGAAGLVAVRELVREGHVVVGFECGAQLGGVWVYTPDTEIDPLGLNPSRTIVHSSLYDSLCTNVPRELMGFRQFSFVASDKPDRDSRRYPRHTEVLRYLEDFACKFKLNELIRYRTEVSYVGMQKDGKWKVKSKSKGMDQVVETFDAVVICNGHFTEPQIANIPDNYLNDEKRTNNVLTIYNFVMAYIGIEAWPDWQCHSHNYRTPEPYQDQVVVLIGGAISTVDICKDIIGAAKEVHVACRSEESKQFVANLGYPNLFLHSSVNRAHGDGQITFGDGTKVNVDAILYCTGYKYRFPFLHTGGAVEVEHNRVGPLYKHVFPPALAPGLSFVGIPNFTIQFPLFELQSKWIAGVLSGRVSLPSKEEMMKDVEAFYSELEAKGVPIRHAHKLGDFQFKLEDWLAKECGATPVQEWRKVLAHREFLALVTRPDIFRTNQVVYDEEMCELYRQAYQEFKTIADL